MTRLAPWRDQSLVVRFVTAGGAVMLAAMLLIGSWITARIEDSVVANAASVGALYLDSFVSPLSQELAAGDRLSEPAGRALAEVFGASGMGERIVSFKIWKPDGLVVHASNPDIIGERFAPTPELEAALRGEVSGSFEDLDDDENAAEAALGLPLLEIYSPIHEVWSGKIIAVAEFYEVATELERDLASARRASWLLVAGVFLASGLMLLGIVRAGGRTIARQQAMLEAQVAESRDIAAQNVELRRRAVGASARAAAQAERSLRQVSADLHDGPAQYVALAAMRLESLVPDTEAGRAEAETLRLGLQSALAEIRAISRGLSLPELDGLPLAEVARRAVAAHLRPTGCPVALAYTGLPDPEVDDSLPDLPLPLPAGDAVQRHAPCPRRRGARRRRGHARPPDRDRPRRRPGLRCRRGPGPTTRRRPRPRGAPRPGREHRRRPCGSRPRPGAGTRLVLTLPLGKGETS